MSGWTNAICIQLSCIFSSSGRQNTPTTSAAASAVSVPLMTTDTPTASGRARRGPQKRRPAEEAGDATADNVDGSEIFAKRTRPLSRNALKDNDVLDGEEAFVSDP